MCFLSSGLYTAMSLTHVREWHFARTIIIIISLKKLCCMCMFTGHKQASGVTQIQ